VELASEKSGLEREEEIEREREREWKTLTTHPQTRAKVGESLAEGQTKVTEKFSAMSTHSNRQPGRSLCRVLYPFSRNEQSAKQKDNATQVLSRKKRAVSSHVLKRKPSACTAQWAKGEILISSLNL